MSETPSRDRLRKVAAKAGVAVAALCVFTAGWVTTQSSDWRVILAVTALAVIASLIAANLSARSR
jgi:hypothetical protein